MEMPFDAFSEATDEALLVLFANGDRAAARVLTERLAPLAFRLASRLLGDPAEAEDVAQEAMLRVWRIAADWRQGEAKVSTWLYTVVRNLCMDRLRKRKTPDVALDSVPEPADNAPGAVQQMTEAARAEALQEALHQLPDRQREAVVLRHLEGLANPEIARILDISTEAVESLTARGKRALKAILAGRREELGYDDE
jgi:RNA polymerase sigma-70 factor (ECF subfamily)